jgi:hypothetical protein
LQFSQLTCYINSHESLFLYLGLFSVVLFLATLVLIPWLVLRIPVDYFVNDSRTDLRWKNQHPLIRGMLLIGKNILGGVFLLLGMLMLVLPGQGLLTILMGVVLLDFPGKFAFEVWLMQRRPIHRSVNWIRQRGGREPLRFRDG